MDSDPQRALLRPLSLVVYLDGQGEGSEGATFFPLSSGCQGQACCTATGPLLVPAKAGRALLIASHRLDGTLDPGSAHGACAAGAQGKLVLQRFFRSERFSDEA